MEEDRNRLQKQGSKTDNHKKCKQVVLVMYTRRLFFFFVCFGVGATAISGSQNRLLGII